MQNEAWTASSIVISSCDLLPCGGLPNVRNPCGFLTTPSPRHPVFAFRIPHPRVRLTNLRNHLQYHISSNLRYKHAPKSLTSKICFCMCHRACRSQPSNKLDPTVEPSYRRVTGSAPLPKASEKLFGRLLTTVSLDNGCLWMVQIYAAAVKR